MARRFTKKLAATTALTASLVAKYGSRSYAATCPQTGPNTYTCSAAVTELIDFSGSAGDVTVVTAPGFSADSNTVGVLIEGDGHFVFDDYASGGYITSYESGIVINTYYNPTGDTSITIRTDSDITVQGTNYYGIVAQEGGLGDLNVDVYGDITSQYGIAMLRNESHSGSISFSSAAGTTLTASGDNYGSYGYGIRVDNYGTGGTNIFIGGILDVSSDAINVYNAVGDISVVTGSYSFIHSSASHGIFAQNNGGDIYLNIGNTVQSDTREAIRILTVSTAGSVDVEIGGHALVDGGNYGITVNHEGTGGLSITNNGVITGDTGILIANRGGTSSGIYINGTVEGTSGTAIDFREIYSGYAYNTTATPITIAGGRIIGSVVDADNDLGFSPVTVTGAFTTEGNFRASSFTVASTGDVQVSSANEIRTYGPITVEGNLDAVQGAFYSQNGVYLNGTSSFEDSVITAENLISGSYGYIDNTGTMAVDNLQTRGIFRNFGTLTIASGSVLETAYMSAGAGDIYFGFDSVSNYAQLSVTGGAADLTGQTLHINVTGATGLADNEQVLLVTGIAPIIGGPGGTITVVDDNSVLWDFAVVDGTNSVTPTSANDLFLISYQAASVAYLADTQNNENTGDVLMTLQNTTNPELAAAVANMNGASSQAEFNAVLESLQPVADMSDAIVMNSFVQRNMDMAGDRLSHLRSFDGDGALLTASLRGSDEAVPAAKGLQPWMMSFGDAGGKGKNYGLGGKDSREFFGGFGRYINQDARGGIAGFDATGGGAIFGLDTGRSLSDNIFGVAFSYGYTEVSSNNVNNAKNEINGFQVLGYASQLLPKDGYLDFFATYAQNNNDTTRSNVGGVPGLTAEGDFTSREFGLRANLGRHIAYDDYLVTPNFSVDWLHYMAEDYTETGAGGANLSVDTENLDSVEIGGEITLQRSFRRDSGAVIVPEARAGYYYNLSADPLQKTSSFAGGGAAFATASPDPARSRATAGIGIAYHGADNWDYSLNYDVNLKSDYQEHNLMAKAAWKF